MGQQLDDFKITKPDSGEIRFLWSGSTGPSTYVTHSVIGIAISSNDCGGSSRIDAISNLNSFTIGDETFSLANGIAGTGYYYYDVSPPIETGSLNTFEGTCTLTSLVPPPKIDTFRNSQYNIVFNNAIEPRRIHRTGSFNSSSGIFEIDRKNNQIIPQNFNAIMSGSATTASFQESNLYTKSWILPRYEGSKLDSGSLFFNDPALTFRAFEGKKYSLFATSSEIRSQSANVEVEEYFFNPPFEDGIQGRNLSNYHYGSTNSKPSKAQPIYELIGKEFKRISRAKIFIPDTDDIIVLNEGLAAYEINPKNVPSISGSDNIFTVLVETINRNGDRFRYWNSSNVLTSEIEIRPNDDDVVFVSGAYDSLSGTYSIESVDSSRGTKAIFGLDDVSSEKTFFQIISSSNNLL